MAAVDHAPRALKPTRKRVHSDRALELPRRSRSSSVSPVLRPHGDSRHSRTHSRASTLQGPDRLNAVIADVCAVSCDKGSRPAASCVVNCRRSALFRSSPNAALGRSFKTVRGQVSPRAIQARPDPTPAQLFERQLVVITVLSVSRAAPGFLPSGRRKARRRRHVDTVLPSTSL